MDTFGFFEAYRLW